jgi:hypothetical protein
MRDHGLPLDVALNSVARHLRCLAAVGGRAVFERYGETGDTRITKDALDSARIPRATGRPLAHALPVRRDLLSGEVGGDATISRSILGVRHYAHHDLASAASGVRRRIMTGFPSDGLVTISGTRVTP